MWRNIAMDNETGQRERVRFPYDGMDMHHELRPWIDRPWSDRVEREMEFYALPAWTSVRRVLAAVIFGLLLLACVRAGPPPPATAYTQAPTD
jgi:hypothetical protein